jgi:hypothetical protein
MLDVADVLVRQGVSYAVIGAMAAAAHGVVRASLDADALVRLQVREASGLRQSFDGAGFITDLRIGDPDDPIPALLAVSDTHGNRVDLLIGLRGLDPEALSRASEVAFVDGVLRIVGREDWIAMKLFGRSGRSMLPMLIGGSARLAEMRGELDALGGCMSDLAIRQAADLDDSLDRLQATTMSLRSALAVRLIPAIDWLARKGADLVRWFARISKKTELLKATAIVLGTALIGVAAVTITAWAPIVATVLGVGIVLGGLVLIVEDLVTWIKGGDSVTQDLLEHLFGISEAENILERTREGFDSIVTAVSDLNVNLAAVKSTIDSIWAVVEPLIAAFRILHRIQSAFSPQGIAENLDRHTQGLQGAIGTVADRASEAAGMGPVTDRLRDHAPETGLGAIGRGVSRFLISTEEQTRAPEDRARTARRSQRRRNERSISVEESFPEYLGGGSGMSIPEYVPSPAGRSQAVSIDAPMTVDVQINEATDAPEIDRRVRTALRESQDRQARQLQAALVAESAQ